MSTKRKTSRILSWLLSFCIVFTLWPVTSFAADYSAENLKMLSPGCTSYANATLPQVLREEKVIGVIPLDAKGRVIPVVKDTAPAAQLLVRTSHQVLRIPVTGGKVCGVSYVPYEKGILENAKAAVATFRNPCQAATYESLKFSSVEYKTWTKEEMGYETVYRQVLAELDSHLDGILTNYARLYGIPAQSYVQTDAHPFLLGISYVRRMYGFEIDGINVADVMLYYPDFLNELFGASSVAWLCAIGKPDNTKSSLVASVSLGNTVPMFQTHFTSAKGNTRSLTSQTDIPSFLEELHRLFRTDRSTVGQWFSRIVSAKNPLAEESIADWSVSGWQVFDVLRRDPSWHKLLLPLLNAPQNSLYCISTPAFVTVGIYDAYSRFMSRDQILSAAQRTAKDITIYLKNLRLLGGSEAVFPTTPIIVQDSFRVAPSANTSFALNPREWASSSGQSAPKGVTEFFAPLSLYTATPPMASAEMSGNNYIRFFTSRVLLDTGMSGITHEMTHIMMSTKTVLMPGVNGRFEGEFYPTGTFEAYYSGMDEPVLNLNLGYSQHPINTFINRADRFHSAEDMQGYLQRLFGLIYLLEYTEADSVLKDKAAEVGQWFHQMGQTANAEDEIKVYEGNPKTINDLVDNSIVAARLPINGLQVLGVGKNNEYKTVPMFASNYSAIENPKGKVGEFSARRYAYELFAAFGFRKGMVPYISGSSGKTDAQALNEIFRGTEYKTLKDFKKAQYAIVSKKLGKIRPIVIQRPWNKATVSINSYADLKQVMTEAVRLDASNLAAGLEWGKFPCYQSNTEQLKAAIYRKYKELTGDYESSIFKEEIPVTTYSVKFNANGGIGNMADVTGVRGIYTLPANDFAAPNGKQFKGWSTTATGKVISGTTITVSAGTTLYAIWEDIPVNNYTDISNENGESGKIPDEPEVENGGSGKIPDEPEVENSGSGKIPDEPEVENSGSGKIPDEPEVENGGSSKIPDVGDTGKNILKLNKKKVTLTVGKKYTLKVKGTKEKVAWSSNRKKVAKVSKNGKVTARKAGKAVITAKVAKKKLKCQITVKQKKQN